MRITNGMMINNTLSNINYNKLNVDKFSTQQSTEKKIQKPSDDPIIAIRALRFRSQLAELNQYLEKNVPDANSWLELSEQALDGVSSLLSDMQKYMDQGANDTLDLTDRNAVITTLRQYRDQIYQDANADYGGRRIFSGYKTDTDMTFMVGDKTLKYEMTENFDTEDFEVIRKIYNEVDVSTVGKINPDAMPNDRTDIHRIRLSYEKLMTGQEDGNPGTVVPSLYSRAEDGKLTAVTNPAMKVVAPGADGKYYVDGNAVAGQEVDPYNPPTGEIYFLSDSGEMIFGKTAYETLKDKDLTVNYSKMGFNKGDLRPEHYFDCTSYTENGTKEDIQYESNQQDINYTVNFNQKLKVNSEGRNLFTHDIIRDLNELIYGIEDLDAISDKIAQIEKMKEDPAYVDKQTELDSMLEAAKKEYDLQDDILQKQFGKSLTLFSKHQATVDAEIADIGSRDKRLQLNKTRLTTQQTTFEDLKSKNEDTDLPETIVKLGAASMVYEASLSAASKVVTKSLLDYL